MSSADIEAMVAGPEMDALVAEKVMGIRGNSAPYSTDIAAAWRVVEKLFHQMGYRIVFGPSTVAVYEGGAAVSIEDRGQAPLAICRAALKAVTKRWR